jgi:choline kinase
MKGVILVAGQGTRLSPLTDHLPKCLVLINGKPILQYQLESLDRVGVQDCVIVVGYREQQVKHQFGPRFGNVDLTYVSNKHFRDTNNLYSLWVAKKHLVDDIVLLDGDVLLEHHLLEDIVHSPHPNIAVVDTFRSHMDGTVVLSEKGFVTSMILKSRQSTDFDYEPVLKTVNIYALSRATMREYLIPMLDTWVARGLTDQFYEAAIAQLVIQGDLQLAIHVTGLRRWVEIDTIADVRHAEIVFRDIA